MPRLSAILLAIALVASACGGGEPESTAVLSATTTNDASATTEDAPTSGDAASASAADSTDAEGTIDDVQAATVLIQAEGTFVSPDDGQKYASAGTGTGFIIDESGLVVTNNHVVTGAALLRVYVDGSDDPVNARVLGVSECNDLAVIDLEGDGYPVLEFRTDDIRVGLDVYSAGFPNPEGTVIEDLDYTLTRGIVSTTEAPGESNWASVDDVIEHDARIRSGNSGGPLVDEQGRVVGVNYSGNDADDYNFAIAGPDVLPVIEQLKNGDVESIGINGEAVLTDSVSGIWVYSVDSGSPADRAGVQAGDLMTTLETLPLATNGSMMDYCDIIRTNGPEDVLEVEVFRPSTGEFLEGQINGEQLAVTFSFANELAADVGTEQSSSAAVSGYSEFVTISDDTGTVLVDVPVSWADRDGTFNDNFGPSVWASPNLEGFSASYDVPGIIVETSFDLGPGDEDIVLDDYDFSGDCQSQGRSAFMTGDGFFTGKWDVYLNCAGTNTGIVALAVYPPSGDQIVRMLVQVVDDADLEALDVAIASFDTIS